MTEAFQRIVRVGTVKAWRGPTEVDVNVFIKILWSGKRLAITGVVGPKANGDAFGSCGQICDELKDAALKANPAVRKDRVDMLHTVWRAWHLNDMQAGTPAQTAELRRREAIWLAPPADYYAWAKNTLTEAGLEPDNGYRWGSGWLHVDVPEDVLQFLQGLPETDIKPAWC